MNRARILVARAIFPPTLARLRQHFEVQDNQADSAWSAHELAQQLADKDGALLTGVQRIDAPLLAACPRLRIAANMTVGYNNFDLQAMAAAGVRGTNTPDVLTETTADFGFALLMATARRVTESEHFLRAGRWNRWSYDMFAGAEVHGTRLGIIGMGRIGQGIARRGAHGFGMEVVYHNRSRLAPALEAECKAGIVDQKINMRAIFQRVFHCFVIGDVEDKAFRAGILSAEIINFLLISAVQDKIASKRGKTCRKGLAEISGGARDQNRFGNIVRILSHWRS